MVDCSEIFVGMDVSKDRHAMAVAEGGRDGEVRYYGEIGSDGASVRRLVRKLERPGSRLRFCYEAGPTGYGLQRSIEGLGHECAVIAPSLIPRRPGERVKTNRRDAVKLARLFRAGELTEIWTPDEAHEAMRDLVRAREAAVKDRTRKRQETPTPGSGRASKRLPPAIRTAESTSSCPGTSTVRQADKPGGALVALTAKTRCSPATTRTRAHGAVSPASSRPAR